MTVTSDGSIVFIIYSWIRSLEAFFGVFSIFCKDTPNFVTMGAIYNAMKVEYYMLVVNSYSKFSYSQGSYNQD